MDIEDILPCHAICKPVHHDGKVPMGSYRASLQLANQHVCECCPLRPKCGGIVQAVRTRASLDLTPSARTTRDRDSMDSKSSDE